MRYLLTLVALLLASPAPGVAQGGIEEHEVRAFLVEYDKAVLARDIGFLERVLPGDYVMTTVSGRRADRAEVLAFFTRERDRPSYRMVSLQHDNVVVRAVGHMAVVTNDYTSQTTPIDALNAEPDTFTGRHTKVLEKREGRWMVIAEQDTEQPRDIAAMERRLRRAALEYHGLLQRLWSGRDFSALQESGEIAALMRTLADEYTATAEDGTVTNKQQTLERFKVGRVRLTVAELTDHNVFAIDNSAAVETGTLRYAGSKEGVPFDTTLRFTRTWVSWSDGWQVVAQHVTEVRR
jgi:hypothetical protein